MKILQFSILNPSTGVATGELLFMPDSHISRITDKLAGAVACVAIVPKNGDQSSIGGLRCTGSASSVLDLCGNDNFITLTTSGGGETIHVRIDDIDGFYSTSGVVNMDISGGGTTVSESTSTILSEMAETVVVT